jgi:hypothetical protein
MERDPCSLSRRRQSFDVQFTELWIFEKTHEVSRRELGAQSLDVCRQVADPGTGGGF